MFFLDWLIERIEKLSPTSAFVLGVFTATALGLCIFILSQLIFIEYRQALDSCENTLRSLF